MVPTPTQDVHTIISGTREYVTLHGKRDSADVIRDFEMGGVTLDCPGGPHVVTRVLRGEVGMSE